MEILTLFAETFLVPLLKYIPLSSSDDVSIKSGLFVLLFSLINQHSRNDRVLQKACGLLLVLLLTIKKIHALAFNDAHIRTDSNLCYVPTLTELGTIHGGISVMLRALQRSEHHVTGKNLCRSRGRVRSYQKPTGNYTAATVPDYVAFIMRSLQLLLLALMEQTTGSMSAVLNYDIEQLRRFSQAVLKGKLYPISNVPKSQLVTANLLEPRDTKTARNRIRRLKRARVAHLKKLKKENADRLKRRQGSRLFVGGGTDNMRLTTSAELPRNPKEANDLLFLKKTRALRKQKMQYKHRHSVRLDDGNNGVKVKYSTKHKQREFFGQFQ